MPTIRNPYFGELITDVLNPQGKSVDVFSQLATLGWTWYHTGGGCTALNLSQPDGSFFILTDAGDPSVPESMLTPCDVGLYKSDDDFCSGDGGIFHFASVLEAVRFVKHYRPNPYLTQQAKDRAEAKHLHQW